MRHILAGALATAGALLILALPAWAQADDPLPRSQVVIPTDPPTFRTTRSVVTVDCVVVDKDGRQVTGLTAADFELKYTGKSQRLHNVAYVPLGTGARLKDTTRETDPKVGVTPGSDVGASTAPRHGIGIGPQPGGLRPTPGSRTIAIVVDDLGLSFESIVSVRNALRRFVDEQVTPGDLVGVIRTSGGIGALQQFTTDKRLLHAAVDRVQWTVLSRSGVSAFKAVEAGEKYVDPTRKANQEASLMRTEREMGSTRTEEDLDTLRMNTLATGSLGALDFVVRGVQQLPGRKAVVFVSEGFELFDRKGQTKVWNAFARLLDRANRAGVVVYTMDGRGLTAGGLTAEDNPQLKPAAIVGGGAPGQGSSTPNNQNDREFRELVIGARATRQTELRNTQEALYFLAWQTGGFAMLDTNDLAGGFRRVVDDLEGYYLLGYEVPDDAPRNWDPGRISVRTVRPGLRVRARQGFFGPGDPLEKPEAVSDPVLAAAVSPFAAADISMRLTSLFGHDGTKNAYMRSLLFIDPNDVRFTRGADGRHEARLDIVQLAVGDNGQVPGNWRRTLTLRLTDEQLETAMIQGVVYSTRMAVTEPGPYQVRTAVRDLATGAVGSASQFIDVPRVGKGRLAVSGVLLRAHRGKEAGSSVQTGTGTRVIEGACPLCTDTDKGTGTATPNGATPQDDVLGEPPVRIFKPASAVVYAYEIYDGIGDQAPLRVSTALVRDARVVYRSPATDAAATTARSANGVGVVSIAGLLSLGADVPPGWYTLQVIVSGRRRAAAQFADFEVRGE